MEGSKTLRGKGGSLLALCSRGKLACYRWCWVLQEQSKIERAVGEKTSVLGFGHHFLLIFLMEGSVDDPSFMIRTEACFPSP